MSRDGYQSSADRVPAPEHHVRATIQRGGAIGRYIVLGLIGRGGMGTVYAAYDPELDRKVAVKLLRDWPVEGTVLAERRVRMLREAQALARLSHPNVVVVYDVGTYEDHVFIAMEFVEGQTLGSWLNVRRRSWREILDVFLAAGRGLEAAHSAGLIHRDFKPENVMVTRSGEVRVMDFGLAREVNSSSREPLLKVLPGGPDRASDLRVSGRDSRTTHEGALVGTPAYMAPEQYRGRSDSRSDQFSFSVALYESLYGTRPFAGNTVTEVSTAAASGRVQPPPAGSSVPRWLRRALLPGLSASPDQRYPSMGALLRRLRTDSRTSVRRISLVAAVALSSAALLWAVAKITKPKLSFVLAAAALPALFFGLRWIVREVFSTVEHAKHFLTRLEGGKLVFAWSVFGGGIGMAIGDSVGFVGGLIVTAMLLGLLAHRARQLVDGESP